MLDADESTLLAVLPCERARRAFGDGAPANGALSRNIPQAPVLTLLQDIINVASEKERFYVELELK